MSLLIAENTDLSDTEPLALCYLKFDIHFGTGKKLYAVFSFRIDKTVFAIELENLLCVRLGFFITVYLLWCQF